MTKVLYDGTHVPKDTPTKSTSAGRMLMTPSELIAREKEQVKHDIAQPMEEWVTSMRDSDDEITRDGEDIVFMREELGLKVSKKRLRQAKKKRALRATKPKGVN